MDEAFSQLRNYAHTNRRYLTDVAADLVAGSLDIGAEGVHIPQINSAEAYPSV